MAGFLNSIYRPIKTVSSKETVVFWISFASSCIFGQIAILGGLTLATHKTITVSDVFLQNLMSANMYTFAIALLAAACALLVIEYVDSNDTSKTLQLSTHKAAAGVAAALLVVVQAMVAGSALKDSLIQSKVVPQADVMLPAQSLMEPANLMQLGFWIVSMIVAQYLFCLTRMHRHPEEIAQMVQAEASELADEAHKITKTKDGEVV